ncbi:hypothetical protein FB45DRAFT_875096 [Roridomyces roridus]|uniref:Uncharacterized protein n=1 Tax=Roridomyces roridus TaxID=1738132 RepID=A0AAD7FCM9_9AGAR|nr:hypothetical protein FB45DRAFT_875096 [Roridomyces roridus]
MVHYYEGQRVLDPPCTSDVRPTGNCESKIKRTPTDLRHALYIQVRRRPLKILAIQCSTRILFIPGICTPDSDREAMCIVYFPSPELIPPSRQCNLSSLDFVMVIRRCGVAATHCRDVDVGSDPGRSMSGRLPVALVWVVEDPTTYLEKRRSDKPETQEPGEGVGAAGAETRALVRISRCSGLTANSRMEWTRAIAWGGVQNRQGLGGKCSVRPKGKAL